MYSLLAPQRYNYFSILLFSLQENIFHKPCGLFIFEGMVMRFSMNRYTFIGLVAAFMKNGADFLRNLNEIFQKVGPACHPSKEDGALIVQRCRLLERKTASCLKEKCYFCFSNSAKSASEITSTYGKGVWRSTS